MRRPVQLHPIHQPALDIDKDLDPPGLGARSSLMNRRDPLESRPWRTGQGFGFTQLQLVRAREFLEQGIDRLDLHAAQH